MFFHPLWILIFLCGVSVVCPTVRSEDAEADAVAVQQWEKNFESVKKLVRTAIKAASPLLMSSVSSDQLNASSACKRSLFQLIADLRNVKPYAVRMVDASAKSVDGILTGSLANFGAYDQCLDTKGGTDRKGVPKFHGRYCTVQAWPPMPPKPRFYLLNKRLKAFRRFENDTGIMGEFTKHVQLFYMLPFRFGICVPSSCSAADMQSIAKLAASQILPYKIEVPRCEMKEETVIEDFQLPILCITVVLGSLVVFGTLIDILYVRRRPVTDKKPQEPGNVVKCLLAFSGVSNLEKILDTDATAESINVLHGIRFYSILWIILGHSYFHLNFSVLENLEVAIQLSSQMSFGIVTNASLVVENFFFISGLLMIYVGVDMSKQMGKTPSPLYFFLHRLYRFLPIQMFFVGVSTLLPLFGSGPLWHENIDSMVDACRTDWWTNLLFINNLFRSGPIGCVSHSWYLAADFQLYLFCIPIVLLILKRPKIGMYLNSIVIVSAISIVGLYSYFKDLPPTLLFTRPDLEQRTQLMREIYYPPYQHLAPFCIGIAVGYYLQNHKGPLKLHWAIKTACWILSFVLTSLTLFGVHSWNSGTEFGTVPVVLYASLSRAAWTLGVAWIVLACSTGCGGVMTKFLRWRALIPCSRLTFLAYMVHPFIQHVFYSSLKGSINAQNYVAIFICFGFVASSYGIGLMLCLLIEAPFINLGKVMLEVKQTRDKQDNIEDKKQTVEKGMNILNEFQANIPEPESKTNWYHNDVNLNNKDDHKEVYSNGSFVCHL